MAYYIRSFTVCKQRISALYNLTKRLTEITQCLQLIIGRLLWWMHLTVIGKRSWTHRQMLSKFRRHHVNVQLVNVSVGQDGTCVSAARCSGRYRKCCRRLHRGRRGHFNVCCCSHCLLMLLRMTSLLQFLLCHQTGDNQTTQKMAQSSTTSNTHSATVTNIILLSGKMTPILYVQKLPWNFSMLMHDAEDEHIHVDMMQKLTTISWL